MSAYSPLGAHVHVRVVDPQAVSRGGIVIPDTAKKRPLEGVVIKVGPGWRDQNGRRHSLGLEPGERVMFTKYGPTELETEKDLCIHKDYILAVIGRDGETIRAFEDNVILRMAPAASLSSIIDLRDRKAKHRKAKVLVAGPGHVTPLGAFIENELKEGQEVVVEALCGQDYSLDFTLTRTNKSAEFDELFGEVGDYRIVRADECLSAIDRTNEGES